MNISTLLSTVIATLFLLLPVTFSHAEETVHGWQLMTEQERGEHRTKMRSFETEQEREAYRLEHHQLMQARAKEQGVRLSDTPPQRGKGMGRGRGDGSGQRMGGGGGRYR